MRHLSVLRAEQLESRDIPATFGIPWPDGQHLTLSFAPDGTTIDGRPSTIGSMLSGLGPDAQTQVLQAFQTWAVQAGIDIGLVGDTGAPFGIGRAVQGDPRFGDIRVGAVPLAPDVLAVTAPYALYNNYSGDVVVNAAGQFGSGGYDLPTVLLHEAGHALGLGDNQDPTSVMDGTYLGPRTGLSPADVAAIQALYGPRPADPFEGPAGNNTLSTATQYSGPLTADLTTPQDVDVFQFTPGLLTYGVTVHLQAAGLSLVTTRVELLDAGGHVLASTVTTDPTHNDLTLSSNNINPWATYYVRVSAARSDVFGIGAYDLDVEQRSVLSDLTGLVGGILGAVGLNTSPASATSLPSQTPVAGPRTAYSTDDSLLFPSAVDYFDITVPAAPAGGTVNLLLTVWGHDGAVLNPWVEVDDLYGHPVAARVLTADGNTTTIQALGLVPGQSYFLKVSSDSGAVGSYHLSGSLGSDVVVPPAGGAGTLGGTTTSTNAFLDLTESGQVHFVLSADGSPYAGGAVDLVVTAADGTIVARLSTLPGRGRSVDVFLNAGRYQVEVWTTDPFASTAFALGVTEVTDPVGTTPTDPTTTPEQPLPSDGGSGTSPPPPPTDPTQTGGTSPPPPPPAPQQEPTTQMTPATPVDNSSWY